MNRERRLPSLISSDYYWQRKRKEVAALLRRNRHRFQNASLFVELGCGRARDIWSIRDALYDLPLRYECADADPDRLVLAEARKAYHGRTESVKDVSFVEYDITKGLPWGPDTVDLLYSSEVFEHIPDVDALVEDVSAVMRPGGYVLITTPNQPNIFQRSFYSKKRRQKIAEANAEPIDIMSNGTPLYGHVTLQTNAEWDALFAQHNFHLVDYGRGSVWYGGTDLHETKGLLAAEFLLDGLLDLLPRRWARSASDQVIALYRYDGA
jgi:SAM-dependent methyltransferase